MKNNQTKIQYILNFLYPPPHLEYHLNALSPNVEQLLNIAEDSTVERIWCAINKCHKNRYKESDKIMNPIILGLNSLIVKYKLNFNHITKIINYLYEKVIKKVRFHTIISDKVSLIECNKMIGRMITYALVNSDWSEDPSIKAYVEFLKTQCKIEITDKSLIKLDETDNVFLQNADAALEEHISEGEESAETGNFTPDPKRYRNFQFYSNDYPNCCSSLEDDKSYKINFIEFNKNNTSLVSSAYSDRDLEVSNLSEEYDFDPSALSNFAKRLLQRKATLIDTCSDIILKSPTTTNFVGPPNGNTTPPSKSPKNESTSPREISLNEMLNTMKMERKASVPWKIIRKHYRMINEETENDVEYNIRYVKMSHENKNSSEALRDEIEVHNNSLSELLQELEALEKLVAYSNMCVYKQYILKSLGMEKFIYREVARNLEELEKESKFAEFRGFSG